MPFPTNHLGVHRAIESAGRILKETRCQAVKLEGGADQAEVIRGLVSAGIPVMAHVGLRPQNVHQMGGYRAQRDAKRLHADADGGTRSRRFCRRPRMHSRRRRRRNHGRVEDPHDRHRRRSALRRPGPRHARSARPDRPATCPNSSRQYADLRDIIWDAANRYRSDVESGAFPAAEHQIK